MTVRATRGPGFFKRRRVAIEYQAESAECGLACLAMIMTWHGQRTNTHALRRRWPISPRGLTAAQLVAMASEARLSARALQLELGDLGKLGTPCILHWKLDHFVVLEKVSTGSVTIVDPAIGRRKYSMGFVSRNFTGVALELTPASNFSRLDDSRPLRLGHFISASKGIGRTLAQLLLLSVALQVFTLATPFYSQIVIDDIVVSADVDLLRLAAICFAGLALFIALSSALRAWVIVYISSILEYRWSSALFGHLVRLPFDYFEKRHVGDIQSRFGSLDAVRNLITTQAVEAVIDGLMTVTTLIVMVYYSPLLTALVAASVLVYLVIRAILFGPLQTATRERIVRKASLDSWFLESIRGIVALRNFGGERVRRRGYESRMADVVAATVDAGRLTVWQQAANQAIFGLQNVLVIWIAARSIIAGGFTVGMMVAFLAYKVHFTNRCVALIDKLFQFRLLRVHLDRLQDIVDTPLEPGQKETPAIASGKVLAPQVIALGDVSYRYGAHEPWVLKKVSLRVERGEHVAIAGPSGCGKSTMLKILAGLVPPTTGELLVNGNPVGERSVARYRESLGVVMQNDQLLGGSLLDNISFFTERPDIDRAEECCRMAGVLDEILQMPMGLHTLVGDMGDSLSGGQKQRILLARALYRNPSILLLDEATSHLDAASESALVAQVCKLDMTRIVIAHRAETLRHADRVVELDRSLPILPAGQYSETIGNKQSKGANHQIPDHAS